MASVTPLHPSGTASGAPIAVAATATPGTLFHTATNVTGVQDEVWIYACNIDTVSHTLTIELGGVATKDKIVVVVPASSGAYLVVAGIRLSSGLVVRCFADTTNVINVHGNINRYAA